MPKKIRTTNDVAAFAKQLIEEGVNFHPDEDFKNYINLETKEQTYSDEDAELRNKLMQQCFKVCKKEKVDICDLMNEVALKETKLSRVIPLPIL